MSASAPIHDLDSFDVVGQRKDGGVDLVVSCSGPLDASKVTIGLLNQKVSNYLVTLSHPNFANVYPAARSGPVRIFISCAHEVSSEARSAIDTLAERAGRLGVELLLVKHM
jgi:hypothetical protein